MPAITRSTFVKLLAAAPGLVALARLERPTAAAASPSPGVVYEGLAFPTLPWESRWIEIDGLKMHYIDIGDPCAEPVLFLHGIPTWLYIWRNIIPAVARTGRRVIALDFVGFGRSDKATGADPATAYSLPAQSRHLDHFIAALGLRNVTLVLQDLGSAVGFDYASRHEANVAGIAFMEAAIPVLFPPTPASFDLMDPDLARFFASVLPAPQGEQILLDQNAFVETFLSASILRTLTPAELDAYRAPFPTPADRLPILWGGPRNLVNPDAAALMAPYAAWLPTSRMPKLMFTADPGAIMPRASVEWATANLQRLDVVPLGPGRHFVQEDHPDTIGRGIAHWLERRVDHRRGRDGHRTH